MVDVLHRNHGVMLGVVAAVTGVVTTAMWFYPFGRLFDPAIGGDEPVGLFTELMLGFVGGLVLSPFGACVGVVVGKRLGGRPLRVVDVLGLVAASAGLAVAALLLFSGGSLTTAKADNGLVLVAALGGVAGLIAVATYEAARRLIH